MSRVGKKTIKISSGTQVSINDSVILVSGKLGKVERLLPKSILVENNNSELKISSSDSSKPSLKSLHGLTRTLIDNMVKGVETGFVKQLELQGVGYRAQVQGSSINLQVGFSHPVDFKLPEAITASIEANTKITLKSADKELLGLYASKLRKIRPPEPYKGKGIRYLGEKITLKQGKTAGK